jgi:hypothetical protein
MAPSAEHSALAREIEMTSDYPDCARRCELAFGTKQPDA